MAWFNVNAPCLAICLCAGLAVCEDGRAAEAWNQTSVGDPTHRGGLINGAQFTMYLPSGEGLETWVRCWTATGLIDTRFTLHNHARPVSGAVAWQFDQTKQRSAQWRVSALGDAVVMPDPTQIEFLRLMRMHRNLRLRLSDVDSNDLEFVVSLSGSNLPIAAVTSSCAH